MAAACAVLAACAAERGGSQVRTEAPAIELEPSEPESRRDSGEPEWEEPKAKTGQPCDPASACSTGLQACDAFVRAALRCGPAMHTDMGKAMQQYAKFIRELVADEPDPQVRKSLVEGCASALTALQQNAVCDD
jgi:hypothetical protein